MREGEFIMASLKTRFKNAWNIFRGRDPTEPLYYPYDRYSYQPNRLRMNGQIMKSMLISMYNKIAIDVSQVEINHVKLDENKKYLETLYNSNLNNLLTLEANIDQTGTEFIRSAVMEMLNDGCCALVPTSTTENIYQTDSYEVQEARIGKIISWSPYSIIVELYNEETGRLETISVWKKHAVILENPFYAVMNEPNATGQRLIRTLNQIDQQNADVARGKWNLIIQTPWAVRSKGKRDLSENRLKEIENQLSNSPHGIAYLDANESVIQLNRAIGNDLWNQAKDLQEELLNQLGISIGVFNGTANDQEMLNYYDRVVNPILGAIAKGIERKWLTPTARTQGQSVRYFRNPFSSVPLSNIADVFDKMKSNEIMTSNECRANVGLKPINDGRADELINASINVQENVNEKKKKLM